MITLAYRFVSLIMALVAYVGFSFGDMGTQPFTPYLNVKYGEGKEQVMDIYVPDSAYEREYNGVILYIHGGSWTGGDKMERIGDCTRLARNGYITATMNYTLQTPENNISGLMMVDEIKMAVQKLKDFSDSKGLNITKLATSGYSAGAHLSALYAYSRADESPIEIVFTANRVAPSDFHPESWDDAYYEGMSYNLAGSLAGVKITPEMIADGRAEEVVNSVSPAYFVNENSVPTIAGFGGKDTTVPAGNAAAMKKALEASGIDYTYIFYPNSSHMLFEDYLQSLMYDEAVNDYLLKYFGY